MHIMIDLETFGTDDNAPVIQLGAVAFRSSQSSYDEISAFLVNISLTELLLYGYEIDKKTVSWWRDQSEDAQRGLLVPAASTVQGAVQAFINWKVSFQPIELEGVWSHGAAFDLPKVRELFNRVGCLTAPWNFWLDRDTRTLFQLAEMKGWKRGDAPVIAHNALHDARAQAKDVVSAMAWLMGGVK